MTFVRKIACLLASELILSLLALAGAAPPCVKAVSSNNGKFLVISTFQREEIAGSRFTRTARLTLEVFPRENFINAKDRVTAPENFWTDWSQWSIVLDSQYGRIIPGCPLPLITDDGEFLILLNEGTIIFGDPALRIYRRPQLMGDHYGVLVRDIPLKEIWPAASLPRGLVTDETPQWFGGGTFEFSGDSQTLIHMTRWGNTVRISLLDGSVWNDNANLGCFLPSWAQQTGSFLCP